MIEEFTQLSKFCSANSDNNNEENAFKKLADELITDLVPENWINGHKKILKGFLT